HRPPAPQARPDAAAFPIPGGSGGMTDLILYTTEDGRSQIKLRAEQHTVWLTQLEMADLFNATKQNISLHLKNLFADGELAESAVVKESLTAAADGAIQDDADRKALETKLKRRPKK